MAREEGRTESLRPERYRTEFPITEHCTYLNHASTSPLPKRSLDTVYRFFLGRHESGDPRDEECFAVYRRARSSVARLLGGDPRRVALTFNTSTGLNIVAHGLDLRSGDNIIVGEREFPANVWPWLNLRRKGVEARFIPMPGGRLEVEAIRQAMDRRTRIVAASLVQFSSGYRLDLSSLAELCHRDSVWLAIDATQAAGAVAIEPDREGIDFLAAAGPKWLMSPQGTGFLYSSKKGLAALEPPYIGWLGVKGSDDFQHLLDFSRPLHDDARRLEVGSLPIQDFYGMESSLGLLLEVGIRRIEERRMELADQLIFALERRGYPLLGSTERVRRSGIVAFTRPNASALATSLAGREIYVSAREGAIRVSPHFYNTEEEIERFIAALDDEGGVSPR